MESETSRGRPKVVLEKIQNEEARQVSFSKRRGGLFKKAMELHTLCGAETAIVVFSPSGKPYSIGHPSVEAITDRFLGENVAPEPAYVGAYRDTKLQGLNEEYGKLLNQLETETNKAEKHKEEMKAGQNQPWWEQPIENLEFQQLELLHATYQTLKNKTETQMNQNRVFINNYVPSFEPQMNQNGVFINNYVPSFGPQMNQNGVFINNPVPSLGPQMNQNGVFINNHVPSVGPQMNHNGVFINNHVPSFEPQMNPMNTLGGSHYEANPHPNNTAVGTWTYPTGYGGAGKY